MSFGNVVVKVLRKMKIVYSNPTTLTASQHSKVLKQQNHSCHHVTLFLFIQCIDISINISDTFDFMHITRRNNTLNFGNKCGVE